MSDQIKFEILVSKLNLIEKKISSGIYSSEIKLKRSSVKWAGANVVISSEPVSVGGSDFLLVSPYAGAIGWYFDEIKNILFESNVMDYLSKFALFKKMARFVTEDSYQLESTLLLAMHKELQNIIISWDNFDSDNS